MFGQWKEINKVACIYELFVCPPPHGCPPCIFLLLLGFCFKMFLGFFLIFFCSFFYLCRHFWVFWICQIVGLLVGGGCFAFLVVRIVSGYMLPALRYVPEESGKVALKCERKYQKMQRTAPAQNHFIFFFFFCRWRKHENTPLLLSNSTHRSVSFFSQHVEWIITAHRSSQGEILWFSRFWQQCPGTIGDSFGRFTRESGAAEKKRKKKDKQKAKKIEKFSPGFLSAEVCLPYEHDILSTAQRGVFRSWIQYVEANRCVGRREMKPVKFLANLGWVRAALWTMRGVAVLRTTPTQIYVLCAEQWHSIDIVS